MHRLRDHALSVSKELKTWVAVISLTLLASAAWADPQSEISVYRKSYGRSNRRRKTHRTRPPASKCDGREAFDGSQCVCIL